MILRLFFLCIMTYFCYDTYCIHPKRGIYLIKGLKNYINTSFVKLEKILDSQEIKKFPLSPNLNYKEIEILYIYNNDIYLNAYNNKNYKIGDIAMGPNGGFLGKIKSINDKHIIIETIWNMKSVSFISNITNRKGYLNDGNIISFFQDLKDGELLISCDNQLPIGIKNKNYLQFIENLDNLKKIFLCVNNS